MTTTLQKRRQIWILAVFALGALVGGVVGYWIMHAGPGGGAPAWADIGALLLSVALIGQGGVVLVFSLSRRVAGEVFIGEVEGQLARPAQILFFRQQAGVLILAGLMLALPIIPSRAGGATSIVAAYAAMTGITICFAAQTVLNIQVWRRADEFMRRMIAETSVVSFWLLQGALFLWASAERLALAPHISTWECTVIMMTVYLGASGFIGVRNQGSV